MAGSVETLGGTVIAPIGGLNSADFPFEVPNLDAVSVIEVAGFLPGSVIVGDIYIHSPGEMTLQVMEVELIFRHCRGLCCRQRNIT